MSDPVEIARHAAAPEHLPYFMTAPGQVDQMMVVVGVVLLAAAVGLGSLFLTVHSLPERWAHRLGHRQVELIAVLCLLALFTHQNVFWVAALVIALVKPPDFEGPLKRAASALEKLAERERGEGRRDV